MLKTGEFSRLANITTKTLQHYDSLGLLKPVRIDHYSGYRYYSLDQYGELNRILILKDLGFSFQQIKQLLENGLSAEEMQGILKMKQIEILDGIEEERQRLSRIEYHLRRLGESSSAQVSDVNLKPIESNTLLISSALLKTTRSIEEVKETLIEKLQRVITELGLTTAGPPVLINREVKEQDLRLIEIGIPLTAPLPNVSDVLEHNVDLIRLPACNLAASLIHKGSLDASIDSYVVLYQWIKENGYRVCGFFREHFLENQDGENLVEIQCPVEPVPFPVTLTNSTHEYDSGMISPEYQSLGTITLAGLQYTGGYEKLDVSKLWQKFQQKISAIPDFQIEWFAGLCQEDHSENEVHRIKYTSGAIIMEEQSVPEDMQMISIQANDYAVFTHQGNYAEISDTLAYIYEFWLPSSGYKLAEKFILEKYSENFPQTGNVVSLKIYIPIKKR